MALVLRKAVLPKNVSLLKCFKGRPVATAANKKNPAALSTAVPCRSLKDKAKMLPVGSMKIQKTKQLPSEIRSCREQDRTVSLRFCRSCPDFVPASRTRHYAPRRSFSPPGTRPISHQPFLKQALYSGMLNSSAPCMVLANQFHTCKHDRAKACPCPSGCPSCCNCCLPGPCNTPPKCVQYMTGYYYYPYGFWFCGPYHVTGTCVPVCCGAPCSPPCGPCPPCGSCGPCGPCAKCCAVLNPVAAAVVGGTETKRASKPVKPSTSSDLKFPLQQQEKIAQINPSRSGSSGISKFFPFSAVPAVDLKGLPHTTAVMCPLSTHTNASFPEKTTVFCTPYVKQTKSHYSTRPRQPTFSFNNQRPKKPTPNSLKSGSDSYEKRTESRSPIHHKRSKKFVCDVCPVLESPKVLMSQERRDRPYISPGAFDYANIPNYRNPYAQPCNRDSLFGPYEYKQV